MVGGVPVPAAAVLAPAPLLASVSAPILSPVKTVKTVPPAAAALPSPQHPHKVPTASHSIMPISSKDPPSAPCVILCMCVQRVSGQWGRYVHYRLEQVTQALEQAPDLATTIDLQVPQTGRHMTQAVVSDLSWVGCRPACAYPCFKRAL